MREVVKRNVSRNQSSKRTRRRRRNMPLYVFLVLILVLVIGVVLSVTLFFNIKKITVSGDSDYSEADIIKISGIKTGDNLVRLDASGAEKKILGSMIYIEDVDVKKKYPDSIEIKVTKSEIAACVTCDDGFLLVSKKGKILDKVSETDGSIVRIDGFEPANENLGSYLTSTDSQKDSIVTELLDGIFSKEKQRVKSVDMTDKYAITVNYEDRIIFELGNSNDITYKLDLADTVLNDMNDTSSGRMVMVGTNQISFRNSNTESTTSSSTRIPLDEKDMPSSSQQASEDDTEAEDSYEEQWSEEDEYSQQDEYYGEEEYEDNYYDDENYE